MRDARREFEAGDLSADAFAEVESREHAALDQLRRTLEVAEADEQVAAAEAERAASPRRRRRGLLWVALGCFGLAAGVLLWHSFAPRQPGQSATGSISTSQRQELAQLLNEGEVDVANGNTVAAVAAYDSALLIDNTNVEALTESGWLHFTAGAAAKDVAAVDRGSLLLASAVNHARTSPSARLYYAASLALTPGHQTEAAYQFRIFLRLQPNAAQLAVARPYMRRVGVAG